MGLTKEEMKEAISKIRMKSMGQRYIPRIASRFPRDLKPEKKLTIIKKEHQKQEIIDAKKPKLQADYERECLEENRQIIGRACESYLEGLAIDGRASKEVEYFFETIGTYLDEERHNYLAKFYNSLLERYHPEKP